MTHITKQSERDENAAINNCQYSSVPVWRIVDDGWNEPYEEWAYENQCGNTRRVSVAKDQCLRCGKTFTY